MLLTWHQQPSSCQPRTGQACFLHPILRSTLQYGKWPLPSGFEPSNNTVTSTFSARPYSCALAYRPRANLEAGIVGAGYRTRTGTPLGHGVLSTARLPFHQPGINPAFLTHLYKGTGLGLMSAATDHSRFALLFIGILRLR